MSQNAVKRLYLMQVGSMPEYQIPIVCYLVQTGDSKNILIASGLPERMPEGETEFDHAGRHAAFTKAQYVVQRVHHGDAASNPRFAALRPQWDQPLERMRLLDGDTQLLEGLELIDTSGHVPGHQSVLVRLPKTGAVLLTIDAVPFRAGFVRDLADDGSNPDAEAIRASTNKLLDLVERAKVGLVIFGHDIEQWEGLKKLPEYYE